jgi:CO/xanthine dehydrogenase Mo-binding subunit
MTRWARKGIGELGAVGIAGATANAVHRTTGDRVRGFPGSCDEPAASLAGVG